MAAFGKAIFPSKRKRNNMKAIRSIGNFENPDYMYVTDEEAKALCDDKEVRVSKEVGPNEFEVVTEIRKATHVRVSKGTLRHYINKKEKEARKAITEWNVENNKFVKPAGTKQRKRYLKQIEKEYRKENPSLARKAQLAAENRNKKRKNRKKKR
jgi:hypothetical protein